MLSVSFSAANPGSVLLGLGEHFAFLLFNLFDSFFRITYQENHVHFPSVLRLTLSYLVFKIS